MLEFKAKEKDLRNRRASGFLHWLFEKKVSAENLIPAISKNYFLQYGN
jgi:hypothetical protein